MAGKTADKLAEATQTIGSLRRELARCEAELEALRRISEAAGSAFASQEMLQAMCQVGRRVTETDQCEIYLLSNDGKELVLRASTENQDFIEKIRIKVGEGITGLVAQERRPVGVSHDAHRDPRSKYYPMLHEERYESFLSVPLVVRDQIIGVINVRTVEPHEYEPNEEMLLASVAGQVSGALEHLDHVSRLEHQASQFRALSQVSRTITSSAYLEEVLQLLVSETARHLNYKVCTIRLLHEGTGELVLHASQSTSRAYLSKPSIKVGESVAGAAVQKGVTVVVPDLQDCEQYRFPEIAQELGLRSLACVPLTLAGHPLGVLSCYTAHAHEFSPDEIRTLETLAGQAAIAVSHARLSARTTLMQEMHHRVKNSLQQVVSLLRMQLRPGSEKGLEEYINESLNRVQAIATVHDLLSRDDLECVRFRSLSEAILHHLVQGCSPPGCQISFRITGDDVLLPMTQANHVALVLNELVQNAFQHGFPGRLSGTIEVQAAADDERVTISVRNDGAPLPDGFSPKAQSGLGLRICEGLVRSGLAGRFALRQGEMTEAQFSFSPGTRLTE